MCKWYHIYMHSITGNPSSVNYGLVFVCVSLCVCVCVRVLNGNSGTTLCKLGVEKCGWLYSGQVETWLCLTEACCCLLLLQVVACHHRHPCRDDPSSTVRKMMVMTVGVSWCLDDCWLEVVLAQRPTALLLWVSRLRRWIQWSQLGE